MNNIVTLQLENGTLEVLLSLKSIKMFERLHGPGSAVQILQDLVRPCSSFAEIGKKYGLSRERVRQIYKSYLAEHLPQRNGRQRQIFCSVLRPHRDTWPEETLVVWREARKAGLDVTYVNHQHGTMSHILSVNGHLCKVKSTRHTWGLNGYGRKPHQQYFRFSFRDRAMQFYILVAQVPDMPIQFFIVPVEQVREEGIYIPVDNYSPYGAYPGKVKTNWQAFKDAWYLLKNNEGGES